MRVKMSATLDWAVRAMSLSHLGRQMQDENLVYTSRTMYGKALIHLSKSLKDPEEGVSTDTLSATVLLSFYEMHNCTERWSWVRHAGGAANLMRIRGPERHKSGIDALVFLACRYSLIIQSFQLRKKCFLSEPGWRKLSQYLNDHSSQRSSFHDASEKFFQELVDFPGFIFEAVDYIQLGRYDQELLESLVRRGHQYRCNYKVIQTQLVDSLSYAGQEPTKASSAMDDKLFPVVYKYPGTMVASYVGSPLFKCYTHLLTEAQYCGYWATVSMLNVVLIGLESKLQAMNASPTTATHFDLALEGINKKPYMLRAMDSLAGHRASAEMWTLNGSDKEVESPVSAPPSPKDYPIMSAEETLKRRNMYLAENIHYAREVCRSVEWVTSALLGPLFITFALRAALRTLRAEEEKTWILTKLDDISKVFGMAKTEAEVYREMMQ